METHACSHRTLPVAISSSSPPHNTIGALFECTCFEILLCDTKRNSILISIPYDTVFINALIYFLECLSQNTRKFDRFDHENVTLASVSLPHKIAEWALNCGRNKTKERKREEINGISSCKKLFCHPNFQQIWKLSHINFGVDWWVVSHGLCDICVLPIYWCESNINESNGKETYVEKLVENWLLMCFEFHARMMLYLSHIGFEAPLVRISNSYGKLVKVSVMLLAFRLKQIWKTSKANCVNFLQWQCMHKVSF